MNRTSSKSRVLKIQREVVRVLSSNELSGVEGGVGLIVTTVPPTIGSAGEEACTLISRALCRTILDRTALERSIERIPVDRLP